MSVALYECCDCGEKFCDPDTDKHPDEDCCPICGFDEIREVDCEETLAEFFGRDQAGAQTGGAVERAE